MFWLTLANVIILT